MKLSGSEIIIESLKKEGVDYIFGYPGGAVLHIYDALFASNVNSEVINTVEVYPNPALAQVNITNIDFACEIKVVNSLGDIVLEKNVENIKGTLSLDVSHLSQGIYFIKIQAREFTSSTKILIE